ncbi:MAG TPA: NAD-binding protein [Chroococcales cyanobacterium]|jgi:Trk K+ transport system NAD-binding subunit
MAIKTQSIANSSEVTNGSQKRLNQFLVCGLGSLGQQCVVALKGFGVRIIAIEQERPRSWTIPDIPNLLDELIIGDCRQESVLEQARIRECRAVLLVTHSERVNTEAAFAARLLNPHARLVIRSAKENLNELLSKHLGNLVSFEPTQLPVTTFALAALGTETLGFFSLESQQLRVVKRKVRPGDPLRRRLVHELTSRWRRVLSHTTYLSQGRVKFHQWEPEAPIQVGDTLVYVEAVQRLSRRSEQSVTETKQDWRDLCQEIVQELNWQSLKRQIIQFWQSTSQQQLRRVAVACGLMVLALWLCGTFLYKLNYPDMSLSNAFYTTAILLLGGFGDIFGGFNISVPVAWWLRLISLGLALAGTAFVGVLYALLTEMLLSSRFEFLKRRPPVPQQDHVVVIGLGRLGQQVAAMLQEFKQLVVGITNTELDPNVLPELPVITGSFADALKAANLPTAKSVLVATDDEMLNLEVGLMAHAANPRGGLVIRTFEQGLSKNLAQLLPEAQVLCAYELAAEAFAGAAFGEKIENLFRLNDQTVLVTEYQIEADDSLNGLLLAEVAYGYGVMPVLYQKGEETPDIMPSDDIRLSAGDRMVVLATSHGLRRIEEGVENIAPKRWQVNVDRAFTSEAIFEGAIAIARISGCDLTTARTLMHNLPGTLRSPLYKQQAQRLVRELSKIQVKARIVPNV